MEWIAAMQQAITYMEEHLLEEINYEDVAKHVHTSCYEFHRAFSFLTGITANAYIRNRRLSLAGREIVETGASITDIAFKYGYETPESFTKAFARFHGIAPSFARQKSAKLVLFNPLTIKLTVEGGKSMDYRIVQTEKQKFIAMVRSFPIEIINDDDNHDVSRNQFTKEWKKRNQFLFLKADRLPYPKKIGHGSQKATYHEMEKAGYSLWDVKPGTYVVFDCIGEDGDCITETWSKFYKEFLPQMGYESSEETDYEIYYEKGRPGLFCELWIPVKF